MFNKLSKIDIAFYSLFGLTLVILYYALSIS